MQKRTKRPLPHLRFEQIRHGVVGVARMQDQGQIGAPGGLDMGGQRAELVLARRIAVMEVQTGLANPDHLGMLSDFNEFVSRDVRAILGVMGMGADRAPNIVMTFGNRRNRVIIRPTPAARARSMTSSRSSANCSPCRLTWLSINMFRRRPFPCAPHRGPGRARSISSVWDRDRGRWHPGQAC